MDTQIQAYLRVAASSGRETQRIGPFLATFNRYSDNPFLNYAIPDDGATPSPADVMALIEAYRQHGRIARLEYIAQLAPAVENALLAARFTIEGRLPLMTCRPGEELPLPEPSDFELVLPGSGDELYRMLAAQNEAYGGGEPEAGAVDRLRNGIAGGEIAVLARVKATGEAAGGGVCTAPHGGLTEVAAIGVRPAFRRRGLAGALTTRLVREAFAAGVTLAFLMAAAEPEARIYARAGFRRAGEILHISHG